MDWFDHIWCKITPCGGTHFGCPCKCHDTENIKEKTIMNDKIILLSYLILIVFILGIAVGCALTNIT